MRPHQMFYILLGLILTIFIGGGAGFILTHQKLNSQARELSQVMADTTLENERLSHLRELSRSYSELRPLGQKAEAILPTEKKQAEVTAQIDAIVRKVGLSLSSISYDKTKGKPGISSQTITGQIPGVLVMPATFQVSGTYSQLLSLLAQLENSERYMQVSDLSVTRAGGEKLQFGVSLEVFLKP